MASQSVIDKIDSLAAEMTNIQASLAKIKITDKKPRKITEKGMVQAAKLLFYHDHKNSDYVMRICKAKFGSSFKLTFKNYHDVKKVTDDMFDKLSSREKDSYMDKAMETKT